MNGARIICKDCLFDDSVYKCKKQRYWESLSVKNAKKYIENYGGCDCKHSKGFEPISPGDLRKQVADTKFFKPSIKIPLMETK